MPFYKKGQKGLSRTRILESHAQKNGLRHAIFNTVGDKYTGEWQTNKRNGKGSSLINNNEQIYEGDFENNLRQGFGVAAQKLPNLNVFGLRYRGFWKNGKKHGQGIRVYTNGSFFIGNWKNGKRDGYGQMWYADGSYYDGYWSKDLRDGLGLLVYGNGNKYDGSWFEDMKQGKGIFYFLNVGQLQQGIWNKNVCVFSTITMIPFRQAAIKPTMFPIPPNYLVNMEEICEVHKALALRGEVDEYLGPEEDAISVESHTTKNEFN